MSELYQCQSWKVETLSDMDGEVIALGGTLSMAREVKAGMMSVLLGVKYG